jgi:hypothetical protein
MHAALMRPPIAARWKPAAAPWALMGTGLDQIYPRDHRKLADDILKALARW